MQPQAGEPVEIGDRIEPGGRFNDRFELGTAFGLDRERALIRILAVTVPMIGKMYRKPFKSLMDL